MVWSGADGVWLRSPILSTDPPDDPSILVPHTHPPLVLSPLRGHTLKTQNLFLFSIQPPQAYPSLIPVFYIAVPWKGFYSTLYVFSVMWSYRLVRCPVLCRAPSTVWRKCHRNHAHPVVWTRWGHWGAARRF